jgi:hypothetical protein
MSGRNFAADIRVMSGPRILSPRRRRGVRSHEADEVAKRNF